MPSRCIAPRKRDLEPVLERCEKKKRKITQDAREALAAPASEPLPAIEDATNSSAKAGDVVPCDTTASPLDENKVDCASAMPGKASVDDGVSLKKSEDKEPMTKQKKDKKDKEPKIKKHKKKKQKGKETFRE